MLAEKVEQTFTSNEVTWNFKDGRRAPTKEEISTTLDKMRDALAEMPDLAGEQPQIEVGGLIVKKRAGHYDVFVHLGEL